MQAKDDHIDPRHDDRVRIQLLDFVTSWAARPTSFDCGDANCTHFAGAWVGRIEGVSPLRRVEYTPSALAAARYCDRHGGLAGAVSNALARDPIDVAQARVGDVVLIPRESRVGSVVGLVGICAGSLVIVRAGDSVTMLHIRLATKAWRVRCAVA